MTAMRLVQAEVKAFFPVVAEHVTLCRGPKKLSLRPA